MNPTDPCACPVSPETGLHADPQPGVPEPGLFPAHPGDGSREPDHGGSRGAQGLRRRGQGCPQGPGLQSGAAGAVDGPEGEPGSVNPHSTEQGSSEASLSLKSCGKSDWHGSFRADAQLEYPKQMPGLGGCRELFLGSYG